MFRRLPHRGIGSRGFAPIDPSSAEGAYVVLSTRQGKTAEDGEAGQGSPFARAVAATLPTAGLRIEDAAARIRKKVREETSDAQDPDVVRSDLPEGGVVLMGAADRRRRRSPRLRRRPQRHLAFRRSADAHACPSSRTARRGGFCRPAAENRSE